MTGRDLICRDPPQLVDMDEDGNEVGRRWTTRAEETRLREGDVHHAVGCAVAQADGDGGCKFKELEEVRGNAAGRNVAKDFSMMSECSRAVEIGLIRALGPGPRRPERAAERSGR
jgi:hypothetical protein